MHATDFGMQGGANRNGSAAVAQCSKAVSLRVRIKIKIHCLIRMNMSIMWGNSQRSSPSAASGITYDRSIASKGRLETAKNGSRKLLFE